MRTGFARQFFFNPGQAAAVTIIMMYELLELEP